MSAVFRVVWHGARLSYRNVAVWLVLTGALWALVVAIYLSLID